MAIETKYIVKREFKYNGTIKKQGEEFIPDGGKWDKKIIDEAELVTVVNSEIKPAPPAAKTRRKRGT